MGIIDTTPTKARRRLRLLKVLLGGVACFVIVWFGYKAWYHHEYPYGSSHACSKGLGLALRLYAGDHEDWLPHGKATPESSLSLLYQHDRTATWFLGGKNIPTKVVEAELARDGMLKPEFCGWHYIEGLQEVDDPEIAVAWDKVTGLGHNGQRRSGLEHEVVLLDGSTQFITTSKWSQFLTEQKERLSQLIASRQTNAPPVRWSDEVSLGPNRFPPASKNTVAH